MEGKGTLKKQINMSQIVLDVKNISKIYHLISKSEINSQSKEHFAALNNISFQLYKGEILGIIGQNGAGKSTLLKILSEVIPPSSGSSEFEGSMLSILDIGTGFHPDLSGYENIFLNASILGMRKQETISKIDEIIEFSGIKDFIHEPIKNFSNGMYLRLALSIALFSSNGIILLDEVISVGDAEFRLKAVNKIREQANAGRACIMISHDINSILQLCDTCILLDKGNIVYHGKPATAVQKYQNSIQSKLQKQNQENLNHTVCKIEKVITDKEIYFTNEDIVIKINIEAKENFHLHPIIKLRSHFGPVLTDSPAFKEHATLEILNPGNYITTCIIPANLLNAGNYMIDVMIGTDVSLFIDAKNIASFNVIHQKWEESKNWNTTNEIYPIRYSLNWNTIKSHTTTNNKK